MSQEEVEVVRRFWPPGESEDLVPWMRELVERLGPDFEQEAALAYWAQDPRFQHMHPTSSGMRPWGVCRHRLAGRGSGPCDGQLVGGVGKLRTPCAGVPRSRTLGSRATRRAGARSYRRRRRDASVSALSGSRRQGRHISVVSHRAESPRSRRPGGVGEVAGQRGDRQESRG
jgi:hypothetical protein